MPTYRGARTNPRNEGHAAATEIAPVTLVDLMIDRVLDREGGFVDHPADRGGPTNFGITLDTLACCRGAAVTREDVRRMKQDEARAIYRNTYFTEPGLDKLPALVQHVVFDMAINHGPGTAIRLLQEVVDAAGFHCIADGCIGLQTMAAVKKADRSMGKRLINQLVDRRIQLYEGIVKGRPNQAVFLSGWLRRANEFRVA